MTEKGHMERVGSEALFLGGAYKGVCTNIKTNISFVLSSVSVFYFMIKRF